VDEAELPDAVESELLKSLELVEPLPVELEPLVAVAAFEPESVVVAVVLRVVAAAAS
jgi:hypothetical protein